MPFLQKDYEKPVSASRYYKFQQGDNRFRILSDAITGYIDWTEDKKPVRTKDKPEKSINPERPAKHFWAFVIWDYREKNIKIMELTQSTIQDAIYNLHCDADWGDPKDYDLKAVKSGEKLETKYSVNPAPKMILHPEIAKLYKETPINLNELYKGGDPFNPTGTNYNENPFMDDSVPTSEIAF